MTGLAELPKRWRILLDTDDATLSGQTASPPKREMKFKDDMPRNGRMILPDHLIKLQEEHAGRPMATLMHAALVVLIRRELHLDQVVPRYFGLWQAHGDLLLSSLSFRWLVSAADTFADHGRSPTERICGLAASAFANTIKFYETERVYSMNLDPTAADLALQSPQFDLDGIVPFNVERGDTAGNLFKRKDRVIQDQGLAGQLLSEVMARATRLDTVYARFRKLHKSRRHGW